MARNERHAGQRQPFFEASSAPSVMRRALGEGVATAALTMAVIFSAQAAWLGTLRPLALALGVPGAVAALTLSFGPATGAHFNPLVTICQWVRGHRNTVCLLAYVVAQCLGALVGAEFAGALTPSAPHIAPPPAAVVIGSEAFASAGLLTIVLAASLVTGPEIGLLAVVAWLIMVNLGAPAGPYANPVLALAVPLATGTLSIPTALLHIAAELGGAAIALLTIALIYPALSADMHDVPRLPAGTASPSGSRELPLLDAPELAAGRIVSGTD